MLCVSSIASTPPYARKKSIRISLSLDSSVEGPRLGGGYIPAAVDEVSVTITFPNAVEGLVRLQISGTSAVQGKQIKRAAKPAEDMMQAFAYRHLVPEQELMAALVGETNLRLNIAAPPPVKVPIGGSATVSFPGPEPLVLARLRVALSEARRDHRAKGDHGRTWIGDHRERRSLRN